MSMSYYARRRQMRFGGDDTMRATDPYNQAIKDEYWVDWELPSVLDLLKAACERLNTWERGLLASIQSRADRGLPPTPRQEDAAERALRRIDGWAA